MRKYTQDEKIEAMRFFEEGFSAREIFEVLNIPLGTLYRWKSTDPKSEQISEVDRESSKDKETIEDLRRRIEVLEKKLRRSSEEVEYTDKPKVGLSFKKN